MRAWRIPLFSFGMAALLIQAAYGDKPNTSPIRLGMVAPLSGDFAPYGEHIRRGIQLAIGDLASSGIKAELFSEDACLPAQERAALSKLVSVDRIQGLAGSYCVIGMVASASILEAARVVSFQTSGGTKEILDAGDYLFTTAARTKDEAEKLAEYAYQTLGLRKAAVLYLTTQWGEEFSTDFSQRFAALGGRITATATNPIGITDFRTELTRLRSPDPDALIIVHLASTLGGALKQARQVGFTKQFLATTDAEEQSVIDVAGPSAEGLKFLAPEPAEETPQMKQFAQRFQNKFGNAPHPLSRHSYDATMLIAGALQDCRLEAECAKGRMYKTKNYAGASGTFSIDPDGGTRRDFVLKTVKDGRFVRAE